MTADDIAIVDAYVIEGLTFEGVLQTKTWKFLDIVDDEDAAKKVVTDFNSYGFRGVNEIHETLDIRYTKVKVTRKDRNIIVSKKLVNILTDKPMKYTMRVSDRVVYGLPAYVTTMAPSYLNGKCFINYDIFNQVLDDSV